MRTFLTFILTCLGVLAANPPIVLNPWSTNQAPPVVGTNLSVRNPASGMQWLFYNDPNSNRVARLWDITNMAPSLGTNFPGIRVSNTAFFSNTYAAGSNYMAGTLTESNIHGLTWTNWISPYPPGITFSAGGIDLASHGDDIPFRFYHHTAVSLYLDGAIGEWVVTNDAFHINSSLLINGSVTNTGGVYYGDGSGLTNVVATGPYIEKSNGFGTNLSIKGFFGVQTTNFVVTNIATTYGAVGVRTQAPVATLHVWSEVARHALLVGSNATTPTLTITNGAVGIGRPDPREALEVRGNVAISGSAGVTNGLNVQGGFYTVNGAVYGTLQVTNLMGATANATALAINTNAATGVAVVQIAGGTNGMTGGYFSPTNQWVVLYTNAIYATGWAVETNGNASAMATRQKYSLFQGLASGPTWAQVGQSNVFFQWGSNAVPPTAPPRLFGSYFDVDSNRVDKVMTEFP